MKRILVLCEGNVARSPVLAMLLDKRLKESGGNFQVASRGLNVTETRPRQRLLRIAEMLGIPEYRKHVPTPVEAKDIASADLVLVQDPVQKIRLLREFRGILGAGKKTFAIREFLIGKKAEDMPFNSLAVLDAKGKPMKDAWKMTHELRRLSERLAKEIPKRLA
ncbi:MAG: hypothetical protein NTY90_04250 [Candidatus Micrarchaeota archaeon]|nr:hypothetical protein [Candidatus Micrarchaeota archaeon]